MLGVVLWTGASLLKCCADVRVVTSLTFLQFSLVSAMSSGASGSGSQARPASSTPLTHLMSDDEIDVSNSSIDRNEAAALAEE